MDLIGYADFGWGDVVGELDGKGKYAHRRWSRSG